MKKHIIIISGVPGSGKSSTARGVANTLGYEHFSSGDLFRKMAGERGLSVEGLNLLAEKQKQIDLEVDEYLRRIGKEKDNLVIDSRTAFHWIPDSFKVFLDLDPQIAAARTFGQIQREGRTSQNGSSVGEVREKTVKRIQSEKKRYESLYNIDVTDKTHFDLIVDTGTNNLEEVITKVVAAYQKWL